MWSESSVLFFIHKPDSLYYIYNDDLSKNFLQKSYLQISYTFTDIQSSFDIFSVTLFCFKGV